MITHRQQENKENPAKTSEKDSKNASFPLNPAQEAAAKAPIQPLLIVAGAGTGKTRTLTSRIVHLIATGTPPQRICAITFTNKAAQEMRNRVVAAIAAGGKNAGPGPLLLTFHSLGARILRKECRALGRTPDFTIFDDHDSFDLLKKVVKAVVPKERFKKDTPAFFSGKIADMKNLAGGRARDGHGGGREADGVDAERAALVRAVFEKYEASLARNNAFDFDDLIEKPVAIFRARPETLAKYQGMFDAILVDEYQDINPKQYELVKLLAASHRNLSVVGDDEQTIYSWRYADIRTFLDFEKEWPHAKIYFLEENYRSTGMIIRAAAAVAEHNRFRTPKKLWTGNPDGERIHLYEAWGENEEAEWIMNAIEDLHAGDRASGDDGTGKNGAEIAVLYRTNAQSRAIEQALIRRGIPYRIFGGLKFYERREVKDAVAALRWVSNPRDEVARERLEKNLTKRKFAVFREKAAALVERAPAEVMKIFMASFGYLDYLEGNFLNAGEREENIAELIRFASEFKNLAEFLEKVSLLQATDDETAGAKEERTAPPRGSAPRGGTKNEVALMTIHLAKGLEFDNVFLAGAAEGLLPHARSIEREDSVEEERRLMYVAMTRARKRLSISFYGMPSRFVSEIPAELITFAAASDGGGDRAGGGGDDDDDGGAGFYEEGFGERTISLD